MKYLIVYLLASGPLLALTIYSALPSSVEPPPEVPEPLGGRLDRVAAAANVAQRHAGDDAAAVEQLRSGDLLGLENISAYDGDKSRRPTVKLLSAWRGFERTRQVMSDYRAIKTDQQRLADFVRSLDDEPGAGGKFDRIRDAAQRQLGGAVAQSKRDASERLAVAAFERAQDAFSDGNYKACIGRCTSLVDQITAGGFKNLTTKQVLVLRDRAQYRLDWAEIATQGPGEKDDAWRGRIEAFLADRAAPAHAEEKQLHARLRGTMDNIRRAVAIAAARRQVERSIRSLNRREIARVEKLIQDAENVSGMLRQMTGRGDITAAESQSLQRKMALRVRTWARIEFATQKTTASERPDIQEVTKTDGSLLRGYFILYEDKFYRHYTSRGDAAKGGGSWTRLELSTLADKPRLALQWRCIVRYNAYVAQSGGSFPSQKAWQDLLALCRQLDGELAVYRKIPGANTRAFSFQGEAEMAQQVLTHWDRLGVLVGK